MAHLHEDVTAPQLLDEVGLAEAAAEEKTRGSEPASPMQKGLRADEFAAFLARNKHQ